MALRPEEITSVLQRELEGFDQDLKMVDVGTVLEIGDGIARVYGLAGRQIRRIAGISRFADYRPSDDGHRAQP